MYLLYLYQVQVQVQVLVLVQGTRTRTSIYLCQTLARSCRREGLTRGFGAGCNAPQQTNIRLPMFPRQPIFLPALVLALALITAPAAEVTPLAAEVDDTNQIFRANPARSLATSSKCDGGGGGRSRQGGADEIWWYQENCRQHGRVGAQAAR